MEDIRYPKLLINDVSKNDLATIIKTTRRIQHWGRNGSFIGL